MNLRARLLTIDAVASRCGVSVSTIRARQYGTRGDGSFPQPVAPGRWDRYEVDAWLDANGLLPVTPTGQV